MTKTWKAIAKSLTWRIIGTAELLAISYFTTGNVESATHIAGLGCVTSMVLYFVHEKIWHRKEA